MIAISKSGRQAFRKGKKEVKETTFLEVQELDHSGERTIYKRYYKGKQSAEGLKNK